MKITVKPAPVVPPPTSCVIELSPQEAIYIGQYGIGFISSTVRDLAEKLRVIITEHTGNRFIE